MRVMQNRYDAASTPRADRRAGVDEPMDGRLADEPERQAGDGDPQLAGGHAAVQVGDRLHQGGGPGPALVDQFLDPRPADRDQGKLRRRQKTRLRRPAAGWQVTRRLSEECSTPRPMRTARGRIMGTRRIAGQTRRNPVGHGEVARQRPPPLFYVVPAAVAPIRPARGLGEAGVVLAHPVWSRVDRRAGGCAMRSSSGLNSKIAVGGPTGMSSTGGGRSLPALTRSSSGLNSKGSPTMYSAEAGGRRMERRRRLISTSRPESIRSSPTPISI